MSFGEVVLSSDWGHALNFQFCEASDLMFPGGDEERAAEKGGFDAVRFKRGRCSR